MRASPIPHLASLVWLWQVMPDSSLQASSPLPFPHTLPSVPPQPPLELTACHWSEENLSSSGPDLPLPSFNSPNLPGPCFSSSHSPSCSLPFLFIQQHPSSFLHSHYICLVSLRHIERSLTLEPGSSHTYKGSCASNQLPKKNESWQIAS